MGFIARASIFMSVISLGFTQPYRPVLGSVRLEASDIGSLENIIAKKGQPAEDLRFETGVVGIVLRCQTRNNVICFGYERSELDFTNDETLSARSCSINEIGIVGFGTPREHDEANKAIKLYDFFFRVTNNNGVPIADTVWIELYQGM